MTVSCSLCVVVLGQVQILPLVVGWVSQQMGWVGSGHTNEPMDNSAIAYINEVTVCRACLAARRVTIDRLLLSRQKGVCASAQHRLKPFALNDITRIFSGRLQDISISVLYAFSALTLLVGR